MADSLKKRSPELDGIRGLAILMIVVYHYVKGATDNSSNHLAILTGNNLSLFWTGVDLFFVLSGFLIGGILIDHRNSTAYFRTFYIRRICRILPIYFLWIALFFILAELLSGNASSGWYRNIFRQLPHFPQWGYFLFLQNFDMAQMNDFGASWTSITWSLCVEEQFYLLMPLLIWLTPPRKLPALLTILIVSLPLFRIFLWLYHPSLFLYVLLPCRADGLLLGVFCAYLVRNDRCFNWIKRRQDWHYLLLVILFLGMIYLTWFTIRRGEWFSSLNSYEMITFGYTWIGLFYACLLLTVIIRGSSLLASIMRSPILRHFGIISYGMYLIHMAISDFVQFFLVRPHYGLNNHIAIAFGNVAAFFIVWSLVALSWNYLEKPIIRWGHSFSYGNSQKLIKNSADNAVPG